MNLFDGGYKDGRFYWSWSAPAFGGPRGMAALSVDPATSFGDYAQREGRGTVGGVLAVRDSGNPAASLAGAWIGLAPADDDTDFQLRDRTYQFWVKTGPDGRFSIPNVLPGTYNVWAFGAGNIGTFKQTGVAVRAGQTLDLGTLAWTPPRVAPTLWEIGVPDRDSHEFRNGRFNYTQWSTYTSAARRSGLTYTVGKSDWHPDWDYAQFGSAPWTIHFSLAQAPQGGEPASLYIGLAGSEAPLTVSVNGTRIGSYQTPVPSHPAVRLGSHGPFADVRMAIPAGLLKLGDNTVAISQVVARGKAVATQYDYLRLEAAGARLSTP